MKLVVLDGYTENPGDLSWDALKEFGDLTVYDRTSFTESPLIAERIGDAEIIITNKTPISRETIDKCPRIKLIAALATGYNVIDYNYAAEKGIPVVNVPTYGTASVSQFSIALLLEICHHIGHHDKTVHEGKWAENIDWCYWDYPLIELEGKTMGIIGFGRIGQAEGRIAKALGMNVIAYDLYPNESGRAIADYVTQDELFAKADVISLHCNLTPENAGLINRENIAKMKDGVILLNNARGQLVNEVDLVEALASGKVAAAGLDVVSTEPIKADNPLLKAPNCIITPHISWAPKESRSLAIMDYALRRRFKFYDMYPAFGSEGFRTYQKRLDNVLFDALIEQIESLNREIAGDVSLGRGFCIGHSYFCGRTPQTCTEEWMYMTVEYDILPMLREYWFDEPEKVQKWEERLRGVLNDE